MYGEYPAKGIPRFFVLCTDCHKQLFRLDVSAVTQQHISENEPPA